MGTLWPRYKILAKENPGVFAGRVAKVLPTAFDDEYPSRITIITGVPRGDEMPMVTVPAIPSATPEQLATVPRKDD